MLAHTHVGCTTCHWLRWGPTRQRTKRTLSSDQKLASLQTWLDQAQSPLPNGLACAKSTTQAIHHNDQTTQTVQGARYCQHVHHPLRHCCSQHTYCVQGVCVGFCGQAAYCSIKIYVLWMGASTPRAEGLGVPREVQLLLVWVCCILGVSAVGETRVRPHPRARLPRLLTFTAILQLPKDYCVQTCQPVLFG
jgi:hypothetical protein